MSYSEKIDFQKIRSFADLFSATVSFTSQNTKLLIRTLAFTTFPFVLLGYLLFNPLVRGYFLAWGLIKEKSTRFGYEPPLERLIPDFTNVWELVAFALFIIGALMLMSTVLVVFRWYRDADQLRKVSVSRLVGQSFITAGSFFLVTLLFVGLGIALALIFIVLFDTLPELGVLILIPLLFVFTYIVIPTCLFFTVRMMEKTNIINTLKRSFYLQRGHWWSAVGLYFLTLMICYSLTIPVLMLSSASEYIVELIAVQRMEFMTLFLILYKSVIFIVTLLFLVVMICFNYFNLVEMKDGNGMLKRIQEIGVAN